MTHSYENHVCIWDESVIPDQVLHTKTQMSSLDFFYYDRFILTSHYDSNVDQFRRISHDFSGFACFLVVRQLLIT